MPGVANPVASRACRVIVSPDKLSAYVAPTIGAPSTLVDVEEILHCLREVGVADETSARQVLQALAVDGKVKLQEPVRVAEGRKPQHEVPAHLEPLENAVVVTDDDVPDHYHRSRINMAHANAPVARLIPATPGHDGCDVYGHAIASRPARASQLKLGANVRLDETSNLIVAACDGSLQLGETHAHVENLLHVKRNVDFSTGNIEFNGDLMIDGGVQDLFEVGARNITIHKAVEAAKVTAREHLHIDGGILGKEKGVCTAGVDLAARFISHATVHCDGPIAVLSEISNSHVTCGGRLAIAKGSIVSSTVTAVGGVETHSIGSHAEHPVTVTVGVGDKQVREIAHRLDELNDRSVQLMRMKAPLETVMRDPKRLNGSQRTKALRLMELSAEQEESIAVALAKLKDDWRRLLSTSKPEILVADRIHPGAVLRFPGVEARVKAELRGPVKLVVRMIDGHERVVAISLSRHAEFVLDSLSLPAQQLLHKLTSQLAV